MSNSTISPEMHYRDAPKAIEWLCRAFGFAKHAVFAGENNTIAHAELSFGNGMIMLSSISDYPGSELVRHPADVHGATHWLNVVVPDADAHYARAKAAGAEIVIDIKDTHYGGRMYTCRDLEGFFWTFGTYDPWAPKG